jgi:endo-1,3(4)-beta-glucanase
LTYLWTQNYGPGIVQFSDSTAINPVISGLVEGMYSLTLRVSNTDLRTDAAEILVLVTSLQNALPNVSITSPANNSTFTQGKPVTIIANASDFDGTIQQVDFYQDNTLITSVFAPPFSTLWSPAQGAYDLVAKAIDNSGANSTSQKIHVTIAPLMLCSETSAVASQGTFSVGYICTFETVGTDVTVTFEMLDPKTGLVAYLWKQTPFTESQMVNTAGKVFSSILTGQIPGSVINYACKFAFSGGMAVTKYFSYVVGANCSSTGVEVPVNLSPILYPNPVQDILHLQLPVEINRVIVSDMQGKKLFDKKVTSFYDLDMRSFAEGIYLVQVENSLGICNRKVLKTR